MLTRLPDGQVRTCRPDRHVPYTVRAQQLHRGHYTTFVIYSRKKDSMVILIIRFKVVIRPLLLV